MEGECGSGLWGAERVGGWGGCCMVWGGVGGGGGGHLRDWNMVIVWTLTASAVCVLERVDIFISRL